MGLFAKEGEESIPSAHGRMTWTRERGTRNLIVGFVLLVVLWFGIGKIWDYFLLSTAWPALGMETQGLTVVGTLDAKGDYDRNLFKVKLANQTSSVELTDNGWRTIFDEKNGALFSETIANTIQYVKTIDGETGDAMLEPYLKAAVARELKRSNWTQVVRRDYPLTVPETHLKSTTYHKTTLGELIDKYVAKNRLGADREQHDTGEAGSNSGHEVEHGTTLPADLLNRVCPVVLIGSNFKGAWLEEQPETVFGGKTYVVHLDLTPEGRSRFFQWSSRHEHESLVFVLQHRVATAGRIAQTMDVNDWSVGPLHDGEMSKALVDYVNTQAKH